MFKVRIVDDVHVIKKEDIKIKKLEELIEEELETYETTDSLLYASLFLESPGLEIIDHFRMNLVIDVCIKLMVEDNLDIGTLVFTEDEYFYFIRNEKESEKNNLPPESENYSSIENTIRRLLKLNL